MRKGRKPGKGILPEEAPGSAGSAEGALECQLPVVWPRDKGAGFCFPTPVSHWLPGSGQGWECKSQALPASGMLDPVGTGSKR